MKAKRQQPRPVFPFAVTLRAAALITEGSGEAALYICAETHGGLPQLWRVPDDCRVSVRVPRPLPESSDKGKRAFLPAGSRVTFQTPQGESVLALHSLRVCREFLQALEAYGQAKQGRATGAA